MAKTKVLLINLGTPDAPTTTAVRRYLREFLMDKRVIDLPFILRFVLVNAIIAPFRAKKSAKAYESIWQEDGSPLLINSEKLCQRLQASLGDSMNVALGMRYGKPNIESALNALLPAEKLIIVPLYPQYASSSVGTAIEETLRLLNQREYIPALHVINSFYEHPAYIEAMKTDIQSSLNTQSFDHLLFSYHGLPERADNKLCHENHGLKKLSYRSQCEANSHLIAKALGLNSTQYSTSFQSRLGKLPWLKPYTTEKLKTLAQSGVKRLAIACPSFICDCLETLEEIAIAAKEQWLELGGKELIVLPALNASDASVNALSAIVKNQ